MAHAEKGVVIHRPVESVFNFVLNGANNKLWRSSVLDVKPLSAAPYGVGSRFEQAVKGPGGRVPGDYEITEFRPNELIAFRISAGPTRQTGSYRFKRQDGATEITSVLDYDSNDLSKSIDSATTRQIFEEVRRADDPAEASAFEYLSEQERQVLLMISEGKSNQEVARSLFLGEGTVRNYVFSVLSKVMEPWMQRSMEGEVGMVDELKAFLEKHV